MTSPTPITVNYTRDGQDWRLTATRADQELAGQAPGLIAARDKADQLAEQLAPEESQRTIVHLLDGDAFAFTEAYLKARHLSKATPRPDAEAAATAGEQASPPAVEAPEAERADTGEPAGQATDTPGEPASGGEPERDVAS